MAMIMTVDQLETKTLLLQESLKTEENLLDYECEESLKTEENLLDYECEDEKHIFESPNDSVCCVNETARKRKLCQNGLDCPRPFKKPVVVLTRLPEYKVRSLRPPTPQQFYSEDESLSSSDSDMQWEPEVDSSDSDFSPSNNTRKPARINKCSESDRTPPPASPPSTSTNAADVAPVIISSVFGHSSKEIITARPEAQKDELKLNMVVLARRRPMRWQQGKIVEIVTREDGRLKYKVSFEEKGKSLVSGHHVAFDTTAKVEQLYVGARVVIQCQDNKYRFQPGVVGELRSRKNRLRFLIFLDDHTPVYFGLPLIHLVWKPLENIADDIPEGPHKDFIEHYLNKWPYPQLTQYRLGQTLNAELNGVLQKCEVQIIDCSLMQVIFQESEHKEWINRGSSRLAHMAKFLEMKHREQLECDSD
ncbi:histone-lysine N-methyltransferase SETDB1-B-like isoform X1 [Astatotilapia calliptera]|uniref:histone-lysine N-methyltransferase SETDB1-B-like isoform X1 n=1 Tax=Astatotilapia calliptera TaxID=8154 RepID=UPI000E413E41|nr:histone-lysine N-methyltransferase SETDB1-B-like isoform X1 [Astatotilapia calliptera]XP_026045613.1 histone-lysine N-methyltransferase SETDB1-B-like isoform X1 [Astatotilapia calliptera]XP_026045614.1 histone-lysine N-methyltransferase SETDB1-B-like isoform X1 [Astatotilapia calliptera]